MMLCLSYFFFIFLFFWHGLWIHNEQGHSRQCPSLRFINHYIIWFCPFTCVPTLWIYFIVFSTPDKRSWILICGQHNMFSDGSKLRYLLKLYKVFMACSYFWRCHISSRCRLEKAPSFSQTTLVQSSKPLGATLIPAHLCLFSDPRWQK